MLGRHSHTLSQPNLSKLLLAKVTEYRSGNEERSFVVLLVSQRVLDEAIPFSIRDSIMC